MNTEALCELYELPKAFCAHCKEIGARHYRKNRYPGTKLRSHHPGHCADCGAPIYPGDVISATEEGWVCESCR